VTYEANGGNILISKLLGGEKSSNSFIKMTEAASIFISSLPTEWFGGQGEIKLREVTLRPGTDTVYFKFSYYFDGIRIISVAGEEPYITVGLNNDEIVYAEMKCADIRSDMNQPIDVIPFGTFVHLTSKTDGDQAVSLQDDRESIFDAFLCYDVFDYGNWTLADWAYRRVYR